MERPRTVSRGRLPTWFRDSAPHLRTVFLLSGSALALAFASLGLLVWAAVESVPPPWAQLLLAVGVVVPPTLAGLVPQLRHLEATAAVSLLRADLGGAPAASVTWSQRARTAGWFWLHLIAGSVVVLAVMFGALLGLMLVVRPLIAPQGERILQIGWAEVTRTGRDAWLVGLGLVLLVGTVAVVVGCGAVLARLAPPLLGPTAAERIAALDAQTSVLVERTRLARELHDSVGHALSVVVLQAAAARRRMGRGDLVEADRSLGAVEETARTALEDLDGVLGLLRDEEMSARRQPVPDLTAVPELVRAVRSAGHDVRANGVDDTAARVPGVVSREAYRIVQEGLTNALRHAPGLPVSVELATAENRLRIEVANPVPSTARTPRTRGGRGLTGIAERAGVLGGSMRATVVDDRWLLTVLLPLPHQETR